MTAATTGTPETPPKPSIFGLDECVYKIYKNKSEFTPVKAKSALQAIRDCGVENVYRVERDSLDKNYVLTMSKAAEMLAAKDQPAAAPVTAAPAPAAETPAAAPAAAEAPKA